MKTMKQFLSLLFVITLLVGCDGCSSTPAKLIATSSSTVDHAMKAWAVYVVDGKASAAQEAMVRDAKAKYDAAEDAAVKAYVSYTKSGDKLTWAVANDLLTKNKESLLNLITLLTGKAVR